MKELSREEKVEEFRIQFGEKTRKGELSSLMDDILNPVNLSQGGKKCNGISG